MINMKFIWFDSKAVKNDNYIAFILNLFMLHGKPHKIFTNAF